MNCRRPSTNRSPAIPGSRAGSRLWCRSTNTARTAFSAADGAPEEIAARRRDGFARLSALYKTRFAETIRRTAEASEAISDLQFTDAYRVPFQYQPHGAARTCPRPPSCNRPSGVTITDLDGNRFYDLTGSYGVNVLGYDFYKAAIERGTARVRELGPVLGPYHPVIIENTKILKEISGLDEVSFHMSGTEAVMQAVRLARYHTKRSHLVRFCGAYHGWWGDVQPGIGNPVPAHETYTLTDMSEDTLRVLRTRRNIACVLVNPLQALHLNASAPPIPRLSTAAAARISTARPMPNGSSACARSAPSATSF